MASRKLLIVCGQTGTGKTSLGLKLAREFNGEIVSADARQAFRYMSIVTGKDIGSAKCKVKSEKLQLKIQKLISQRVQVGVYEVQGTKIWGYDLVRPDEEFSVKLWRDFARIVIGDIWRRGKLPIVVGGTGLYLRALTEPLSRVEVPRDFQLRRELEGKKVEELQGVLKKSDPERWKKMNDSDRQNPRRLVRAIEIARIRIRNQELGIMENNETQNAKNRNQNVVGDTDVLRVGLRFKDAEQLAAKIGERVEERLADPRIVGELEFLMKKDYLRYVPAVTIGYQRLMAWMGGLLSFKEMTEKWKLAERQYAKRQMSWFKKQVGIEWFEVGGKDLEGRVRRRVEGWLGMGVS